VPGLADVARVRDRVQSLLKTQASDAALGRSFGGPLAVLLCGMAVVIVAILLGVRVHQKRKRSLS
jgi:hypothetical protein